MDMVVVNWETPDKVGFQLAELVLHAARLVEEFQLLALRNRYKDEAEFGDSRVIVQTYLNLPVRVPSGAARQKGQSQQQDKNGPQGTSTVSLASASVSG